MWGRTGPGRCDSKCGRDEYCLAVAVWFRWHRFLGYRDYDLIGAVCAFNRMEWFRLRKYIGWWSCVWSSCKHNWFILVSGLAVLWLVWNNYCYCVVLSSCWWISRLFVFPPSRTNELRQTATATWLLYVNKFPAPQRAQDQVILTQMVRHLVRMRGAWRNAEFSVWFDVTYRFRWTLNGVAFGCWQIGCGFWDEFNWFKQRLLSVMQLSFIVGFF